MDKLDERKQRGLDLIQEMMGAEQAERTLQHWQEICPDFREYVTEFLSGEIWSRPGLDRRAKSLATIAALAAMGRTRALELNVRLAMRNGATRQEVVETLLHIAPYAGFPASWEGLVICRNVFHELDRNEEA